MTIREQNILRVVREGEPGLSERIDDRELSPCDCVQQGDVVIVCEECLERTYRDMQLSTM